MNRREQREQAVIFLYILEIGGDYYRENLEDEVYSNIHNLIAVTDEIEDILNKSMTGWNLSRLNIVDKAILKYSVYEMKYLETPFEIAINEALELTKKYSDIDGKQVAFNNKVLDKAKEFIYGDK